TGAPQRGSSVSFTPLRLRALYPAGDREVAGFAEEFAFQAAAADRRRRRRGRAEESGSGTAPANDASKRGRVGRMQYGYKINRRPVCTSIGGAKMQIEY